MSESKTISLASFNPLTSARVIPFFFGAGGTEAGASGGGGTGGVAAATWTPGTGSEGVTGAGV